MGIKNSVTKKFHHSPTPTGLRRYYADWSVRRCYAEWYVYRCYSDWSVRRYYADCMQVLSRVVCPQVVLGLVCMQVMRRLVWPQLLRRLVCPQLVRPLLPASATPTGLSSDAALTANLKCRADRSACRCYPIGLQQVLRRHVYYSVRR